MSRHFLVALAGVTCSLAVCPGCDTGNWGTVVIDTDSRGNPQVTLENSAIRVRYGIRESRSRDGKVVESAIRGAVVKAVGKDLISGNGYIDACAGRKPLHKAVLVHDGQERKTVRLAFADGRSQDVSIFPDLPVLKIDYISYGVNIVDVAWRRGVPAAYEIHGAKKWKRPYEIYPRIYFDRAPADLDYENIQGQVDQSPESLDYKGWFVMGVWQTGSGIGFGRVAPVENTDIIKLLWQRGFELFPNFRRRKEPFASYLFFVTQGPEEILATGRKLADERYWHGNLTSHGLHTGQDSDPN